MNPCADEGFQRRMEQAAKLAGNATRLAEKTGISRRAIGEYLAGKAEPSRPRLVAIAEAAGVRVAWLATGEGPMRLAEEMAPANGVSSTANTTAPAVDEELLARVGEEIVELYRQENGRISQRQLARLQARTYADLVSTYDDPAERLVGLKMAIQQLRRELRAPPVAGDTSKRLA